MIGHRAEVTVERILPGGMGLAHANDRTILVALAAPGDRLRVYIHRIKGGVAFASIVEVIEPSPVRVEPPCPYFGRCGGCDFQQLNYQAQLDAKIAIIRDCLHRLARIEPVPKFEVVPAPNEWHYRARAQWQYDSVRRRLGYFEANSHCVCDVAECAVLVPELQRELEHLRERMNEGELADDAPYFRAMTGDEAVAVAAGVRTPTVTEGASYRTASGSERVKDSTVTGQRKPISSGSDLVEIKRTVTGESYRLNAESFFQTNIDLLPLLIDYALGDVAGEKSIELYCGLGLFTLPLARRFKQVIGVETDADAANFARENLASAGLQNVEVVNRDVADWMEEDLECGGKATTRPEHHFGSDHQNEPAVVDEVAIQSAVDAGALQIDFLLLDPPRAGAESSVINGIVRLKPAKICYVSCDPATLARDLKKLIAGGYQIDRMRAFDVFPQTHHVETVVHLMG